MFNVCRIACIGAHSHLYIIVFQRATADLDLDLQISCTERNDDGAKSLDRLGSTSRPKLISDHVSMQRAAGWL